MATEPKPLEATINRWGNGLAVRLTKSIAKAAGLQEGSVVRIAAVPGRVIVEATDREPTLEEMLASFDPKRHGREAMGFAPVGREVL